MINQVVLYTYYDLIILHQIWLHILYFYFITLYLNLVIKYHHLRSRFYHTFLTIEM